MRFSARIFGLIFIFLSLLLFFKVTPSFAQSTGQPTQALTTSTNSNVPKNMHTWTQNLMIETMSSMVCQLTGYDPINRDNNCLGVDTKTGKIGYVKNGGGAVGVMSSMITSTFLIPVHSTDFIARAVNNFGIVKSAHAQNIGIGFVGLGPVLGLFTIFRNLSYLFMMVIFIIVGIAIMLRLRIDPRTVMTIQNQIPKLIIGLVMITFSYAIAGLLIDVMWISNFVVINTLAPTNQQQEFAAWLTESAPGFGNDLFGGENGGILGLSASAASSVGSLVHDVIASDQVSGAMNSNTSEGGCFFIGCWINDIMDAFWHLIASFIGFVAGIVVFLIFAVAIIVALFRLWFALLKCFINILLGVILGPLWILGGLIPGASNGLGFSSWLRHIAGNLAPFPAIVFIFAVAKTIMAALSIQNEATTFNPPLLGNVTTGGNQVMYGALIAVGFILAAPSVVDKVKKAFGTGGGGLGFGGLGTGQAAVAGFAGGVASRMYYKDPRSGQLKGFVGARVQRFSIGKQDDEGNIKQNVLHRATGFVTRAPSSDYLVRQGASHKELGLKEPPGPTEKSTTTTGTDTGILGPDGKPLKK